MSRLDRPHKDVKALKDAILENDGDELFMLLHNDGEELARMVANAATWLECVADIQILSERLAERRAAQLWAEQPKIYVANWRELKEMNQ
jgi:hypothetical protein